MGNVLQFWATSVWLYNNYRGPRVYLLRFFPVKATAVPSGMAYAILFYVRFVPAWISLGQRLERFAGYEIIQRAAYFYIWMVNSGSWLRSRFSEAGSVNSEKQRVSAHARPFFFFFWWNISGTAGGCMDFWSFKKSSGSLFSLWRSVWFQTVGCMVSG